MQEILCGSFALQNIPYQMKSCNCQINRFLQFQLEMYCITRIKSQNNRSIIRINFHQYIYMFFTKPNVLKITLLMKKHSTGGFLWWEEVDL